MRTKPNPNPDPNPQAPLLTLTQVPLLTLEQVPLCPVGCYAAHRALDSRARRKNLIVHSHPLFQDLVSVIGD